MNLAVSGAAPRPYFPAGRKAGEALGQPWGLTSSCPQSQSSVTVLSRTHCPPQYLHLLACGRKAKRDQALFPPLPRWPSFCFSLRSPGRSGGPVCGPPSATVGTLREGQAALSDLRGAAPPCALPRQPHPCWERGGSQASPVSALCPARGH